MSEINGLYIPEILNHAFIRALYMEDGWLRSFVMKLYESSDNVQNLLKVRQGGINGRTDRADSE